MPAERYPIPETCNTMDDAGRVYGKTGSVLTVLPSGHILLTGTDGKRCKTHLLEAARLAGLFAVAAQPVPASPAVTNAAAPLPPRKPLRMVMALDAESKQLITAYTQALASAARKKPAKDETLLEDDDAL